MAVYFIFWTGGILCFVPNQLFLNVLCVYVSLCVSKHSRCRTANPVFGKQLALSFSVDTDLPFRLLQSVCLLSLLYGWNSDNAAITVNRFETLQQQQQGVDNHCNWSLGGKCMYPWNLTVNSSQIWPSYHQKGGKRMLEPILCNKLEFQAIILSSIIFPLSTEQRQKKKKKKTPKPEGVHPLRFLAFQNTVPPLYFQFLGASRLRRFF